MTGTYTWELPDVTHQGFSIVLGAGCSALPSSRLPGALGVFPACPPQPSPPLALYQALSASRLAFTEVVVFRFPLSLCHSLWKLIQIRVARLSEPPCPWQRGHEHPLDQGGQSGC